jgi:DNA-binding NarL/FixJ family response regulator
MIRTLVVDDSDIVRNCIRTILEFSGDIESEATNGREAITKVLEYQPDLVILDLTMPVMDGFTAAAELRKRLPQLPILFCSIHEGPQVVKQAKQVGARGYVSKEDLKELSEAVDAVVVQKTTYFSALQSDDQ